MGDRANFHFVATDLLPFFFFTFEEEADDGTVTPVDLTVYSSIQLRMRRDDGVLITVDHTVDDAAAGEGHFEWGVDDLTEGLHKAEIRRVFVAGGLPETIPAERPMTFDTRSQV